MRTPPQGPARFVVTLALLLSLAGCSGPGEVERPATPSAPATAMGKTPTATSSSATTTPGASPTPAGAGSSGTALPASPAATPLSRPTVAASPTATRPPGQAVELPALDAHYHLDITALDLGTGAIAVRQRVELQGRADDRPQPRPQLSFSIAAATYGYFALDETRVDGVSVTPERRQQGFILAVPLANPSAGRWTIEFAFRLNLGQVPADWYGSGRDGGIVRLGYWFPLLSTDYPYPSTADPSYSRVASVEVRLPLPPNTPFVATGMETGREQLGDGRVRHHLTAERVRDFAIVIAPGFRLDTATTRTNVTVELLSPPSLPAARRAEALDAAVRTIERLGALIGPYPYPTFRMAHVGPSLPGGIEFPMLVFLNMEVGRLDRLVYHEAAHQWFYGLIGTRPQQDPWIDEGGAQFLEGGLDAGFAARPVVPAGGYRHPLDASDAELPTGAGIPGFEAIYLQGQAFYQTVLLTMGEEAFWAAMRELYASFADEIVVPWDLLALWQRHSAADLRPLYRQTFRYPWIDSLPPPAGRR